MEFITVEIKGSEALAKLAQHRAEYHATGLYPFLLGDAEDIERVREGAEFAETNPAENIRLSEAIDVATWIAERKREYEEDGASESEMLGTWPGEVKEKGSIGIHKDVLSGKIKSTVHLGFAKIERPWHLPAMLHYGGWNECPDAAVQCAVHKHWYERYGAEITGMTGDVIECVVSRPPKSRNESLELAWEQFWYCRDIVEQGCESVENLAATLLNSTYWYFWWD